MLRKVSKQAEQRRQKRTASLRTCGHSPPVQPLTFALPPVLLSPGVLSCHRLLQPWHAVGERVLPAYAMDG